MSDLKLSNKWMDIGLQRATGGLRRLVDVDTGLQFLAGVDAPLYTIGLVHAGRQPWVIPSLDAGPPQVQETKGGFVLDFTHGIDDENLRVICSVALDAERALSRWRIEIRNPTRYGVRTIAYPVLWATSELGTSDENNVYVSGRMTYRPGRILRGEYPCPVHFQAYYNKQAGLCMATCDADGYSKEFACEANEARNCLDLSIRHSCDERPGLDFELPYDTVLATFHGDWHDASNVYMDWARH